MGAAAAPYGFVRQISLIVQSAFFNEFGIATQQGCIFAVSFVLVQVIRNGAKLFLKKGLVWRQQHQQTHKNKIIPHYNVAH